MCEHPLSDGLRLEGGVGLGQTYNTTRRDGVEYDDHAFGKSLIVAIVQELGRSGWNVRAQGEYTTVDGSFHTWTYMMGVGHELGGEHGVMDGNGGAPGRLGVFGGAVQPSGGDDEPHFGGELEYERPIAKSVSAALDVFKEGRAANTDRTGVCAQLRYNFPDMAKWRFAAGAGPCVAVENNPGNAGVVPLARVTFDVERELGKGEHLVLRMNRLSTVGSKHAAADTDGFFLGWKKDLQ